jgi:arylsulfatase A-like enzyme/Tfp pilus assembly protein PilF
LLLLGLALACSRTPPEPAPPPDSVLLITVDTLRADHLGTYGYKLARTPRIDALAADGVRFDDHATSAPITLPAHTSLMTGLWPPAHGVRDNGNFRASAALATWAERMKAAGYETHAFVSAAVLDSRYGLDQGFDTYDDDLAAENAPPMFMIPDRPARRTVDRVLSWLDGWTQNPDRKPFFVWVHLFDPHRPYQLVYPWTALAPTPYDGEIAAVDQAVGRVLDGLEAAGVRDRTLIVFTADHGEGLGEHGETTHGFFTYRSTIRIPWILWSAHLPHGVTYKAPSSMVDVLPTALSVLGLEASSPTQGLDLGPAIRGSQSPPARPQYAETMLTELGFGMAPLHAVRIGNERYIRAPRPELYDIAVDPRELDDLAATRPDRVAALDEALGEILAASEAMAPPVEASPLDGETEAMLRALGYIGDDTLRAAAGGMDPKDGLVIHQMLDEARTFLRQLQPAAAEAKLEELLARVPEHPSGLATLGLCLSQQDRFAEAREAYERSLAAAPDQPRVMLALAQVASRGGDVAVARSWIDRALALSPQFVEAMVFRAVLERDEDAVEAEHWFRRAIEADPELPRVWIAWGDHLFLAERYAEALPAYQKVLEKTPANFEVLLNAGLSAQRSGDADLAEAMFTRAAEVRPDHWMPPYDIACLRAQAGETDEAFDWLDRAIDRHLSDVELLRTDPDLVSLRSDARWSSLVARVARQDSVDARRAVK